MTPTPTRQRAFSCLAAGFLLATTVQAQQAETQWLPMREAGFNAPNANPTATAQEHALLQRIWAQELAGAREMEPGTRFPSAVLIGTVDAPGAQMVFTIYARAGYDKCQPAENGAKVEYSHWVCSLRVVRTVADKPVVRDFPGYCMLWGDYPDAPREKNRVEYAYEASTATIRFRTLEHGKVVPQCNRRLRVQG